MPINHNANQPLAIMPLKHLAIMPISHYTYHIYLKLILDLSSSCETMGYPQIRKGEDNPFNGNGNVIPNFQSRKRL